jgi:hypothetical protein
LVGTGTTEKGIYVTNSKNHRAAKDASVYLVKNNVIDLPSSTGTGTASSPFTNATGTSSDTNAGPDKYTQNVPKIVYFDVVDVPLRAFEAVNHMQTFKLNLSAPAGERVVDPDTSNAGVIAYVVQNIMAEYDSSGDAETAIQPSKRCGLLTFGPCDTLFDMQTIIDELNPSTEQNAPAILIRGDSNSQQLQYLDYRFPTDCISSVYYPASTGTSTSTASA